ncbi:MAG: hypothetical protein F4X59_14255 [Holophagales bacterium]|nr:hypothetical protein [Holophagales bacterium]MXX60691.1 hypothetical protein [Holophagales bacterium]MYC11276.1 hypothetical protein [Holophagales bacterium]MYD20647.1 hypothetical protein [Holophagales bacterium]MYI34223.1 hypothetical protein [Holophagales bacterium]
MVSETVDREYFETIEEEFIRLRGAPLLLSPADWRLADRWRQEGVPLFLVLESIRLVFERRAERQAAAPEARRRGVSSLRYCRPAVEKAWAEYRELGGASARQPRPAAIDVRARLQALAEAIPAATVDVEKWRQRLLKLQGPAPVVEDRLVGLDRELVDRAFELLPLRDREEVTTEAEAALGRMSGRVDPERLSELRRRMVRRLVRERLGLPLLSLFAEGSRLSPRSG